ncbi:phospholipase A2 [Colletotrichum higginsianum]|nr:phospholipase A2 [Colletotrichum higginsianum]
MCSHPAAAPGDPLAELITTYNELNGAFIEELAEEPSPLEFMRYVARNTPFVVRGAASSWQSNQTWDKEYLVRLFKGQAVNVAVTPFGPPSVPFARIALDRDPEAVNLWIGTSRSVTALHKDNYENIYVQIRGCKHFVLLPPCCQPCVNERTLMPATYARRDLGGLALELDEASNENKDRPEDGALHGVPFATWDPDHPDTNATPYSHLAEPVRVTLEPGDMLYLPAMWYHKVSQSCPEDGEGFVLAVNYW